jgi:hypothetical protein
LAQLLQLPRSSCMPCSADFLLVSDSSALQALEAGLSQTGRRTSCSTAGLGRTQLASSTEVTNVPANPTVARDMSLASQLLFSGLSLPEPPMSARRTRLFGNPLYVPLLQSDSVDEALLAQAVETHSTETAQMAR